jgi:hypothetical protein
MDLRWKQVIVSKVGLRQSSGTFTDIGKDSWNQEKPGRASHD